MFVEINGIQLFILTVFILVPPIITYYLFGRKIQRDDLAESSQRRLLQTKEKTNTSALQVKDINWSVLYNGWLKGKALNFEKERIPLVASLSGLEKKNAWSQPIKIGANPLINATKNYLEKFGKAVVTVTTVSRDDTARNVAWGLSSYLNVVAGRVLIFEVCQKSSHKKQSARIDLASRRFADLPDPRPSEIANVDSILFDQPFTWPEDILTHEAIRNIIEYYKNIYPLVLVVAPPVLWNGLARKTAAYSDCCMLIGSRHNDQSMLVDAYQRIRYTHRDIENNSLVIWGIRENAS